MRIDRRTLVGGLIGVGALVIPVTQARPANEVGVRLPRRAPGELDIHHIDTGRGNATLVISPNGTSLLIDAGSSADEPAVNQARPNGSRSAGEWIARYAAPLLARKAIDYCVVTHIHPDHVGAVLPRSTFSVDREYRLTGVSEVDALLPIGTVIDRAYPHYEPFLPPGAPFTVNYLSYLRSRQTRGLKVEAAKVGSKDQVRLDSVDGLPDCKLLILAANGIIGKDTGTTKALLPGNAAELLGGPPNENILSVALRLTYGAFSYFTAGDLAADDRDGRFPWLDVETPVVRLAGMTEVAAADHHGYFDACGPAFVKSLDPQAVVIPAWHLTHPGQAQLQRLLGDWTGDSKVRDVFATSTNPASAQMNARFVSKMRSINGHVVVRVAAGGRTFKIYVVDSTVESGPVLSVTGPYICRNQT